MTIFFEDSQATHAPMHTMIYWSTKNKSDSSISAITISEEDFDASWRSYRNHMQSSATFDVDEEEEETVEEITHLLHDVAGLRAKTTLSPPRTSTRKTTLSPRTEI
jgi:hypothetical protein